MKQESVTGLVTHSLDCRENDRLIRIFSRDKGMFKAMAYGARSLKSGKTTGSTLLAYGEYDLVERHGIWSVNSCKVTDTYVSLGYDYERFKTASFMIKPINTIIPSGEIDSDMYDILMCCLNLLMNKEIDCDTVFVFFLLRLAEINGICPTITECAHCGKDLRTERNLFFSVTDGGAVCSACRKSGAVSITPIALEAMRRMLLLEYDDADKIKLPNSVKNELMRVLTFYSEENYDCRLH